MNNGLYDDNIIVMMNPIKEMVCRLCGYKWYPRSLVIPKCCPKCKRYDWRDAKKKV